MSSKTTSNAINKKSGSVKNPEDRKDRENSLPKVSRREADHLSSPHAPQSSRLSTATPQRNSSSPWYHHQRVDYYQDPSIWREYPPYHEYNFPPARPYFHPGFNEDERWAANLRSSPPTASLQPRSHAGEYQEPPMRQWMERDDVHRDIMAAASPVAHHQIHRRPRVDYGYRPSYHPGEGSETPPRSNRNVDLAPGGRLPPSPPQHHAWSNSSFGYHPPAQNHTPPSRQENSAQEPEESAVVISAEKLDRKPATYANSVSSQAAGEIEEKLGPFDILCGRGAPTKPGRGNSFFNKLVAKSQLEYMSCPRNEKPSIATQIINMVHSKGGRFLRRARVLSSGGNADRFVWVDLPEGRVYEKVCQALREGAPQIRDRLLHLESETRASCMDKENTLFSLDVTRSSSQGSTEEM